MFIELIDLLRCTRPHEDSWLVATFHEIRERDVIEGLLSCPVCRARYPVTRGVACFDVPPEVVSKSPAAENALPQDGMRVAAYLNLVEPGVVVLGGAWGSAAQSIVESGNMVIALNSIGLRADGKASHVRCADIVPLARECLDGVALDSSTPRLVESAGLALKTGARMVAPIAAAVPTSLLELARDGRYWVAVREGAGLSAPVQIARR